MSRAVRAAIGLGGNLGDPMATLSAAIADLGRLPGSRLVCASRLYRTPAWGRVDQPDFVNAAAVIETRLSPAELLGALLETERRAGRVRDQARWGPRVLDLDLLLYGDERIDAPGLRVPHPHLHERAFALLPLAGIAAALPFPGHGTVADAARRLAAADVAAVAPAHA